MRKIEVTPILLQSDTLETLQHAVINGCIVLGDGLLIKDIPSFKPTGHKTITIFYSSTQSLLESSLQDCVEDASFREVLGYEEIAETGVSVTLKGDFSQDQFEKTLPY